jgi:hypothetical protein
MLRQRQEEVEYWNQHMPIQMTPSQTNAAVGARPAATRGVVDTRQSELSAPSNMHHEAQQHDDEQKQAHDSQLKSVASQVPTPNADGSVRPPRNDSSKFDASKRSSNLTNKEQQQQEWTRLP